jgi:hypothetical protein
MLALISSALGAQSLLPADPARTQRLIDGYNTLSNATNQYLQHLLNLKIAVPTDDNYSDDELTFLPYFTWAVAALRTSTTPSDLQPVLNSTVRTYSFLQQLRSDLW